MRKPDNLVQMPKFREAGAIFYAVLADLDAPTGFRQAFAFALVVAMRLASLQWGLQTPLPDDLVRKLTPRRHQGDHDATEHGPFDVTGAPAEELKRAGDDRRAVRRPVSTTVIPSGPSQR